MSDEFVRVAHVADIAEGTAVPVQVGGREVALFHVDGAFYALRNRCPHQGGPLCEGQIEDATVTCPWHAWTFKLADGKMLAGFSRVDTYDVRVEDGQVAVRAVPRPRPPLGR